MTTFASATAEPPTTPLDLTKHVKYSLGMVLGVADFDQEFAYLSGHDRWLARDLSGYGTVWGLGVRVELEEGGPRVNVAPGTAVTPCGRLVCVSPAQCASLNPWLAAHEQDVTQPLLASPPTVLRVYVVLCHRECPTDNLPIPGEPCRTEDRLTAPSRIKDDFRLELRTSPPPQREEDAIRDFVAWLRAIPVVDGPGSTLKELLDEIKHAVSETVAALESPPSSPPSPPSFPYDFVLGSPPAYLAIPADQATEFLRTAFSLWVTELRAALRHALPGCECGCEGTGSCGCGCHSASGAPTEECDDDVVLLAALDLPVVQAATGELVVADNGWEVDDSHRPYVLHTRFLQEWLLSEGLRREEGSPPLLSPPDLLNPISVISAYTVTGSPTADWDPSTGSLDLGIPAGAPGANGADGADGAPGTSFIVAAGSFGPQGGRRWHFDNLQAQKIRGFPLYHLTFDSFADDRRYIVKGTVTTGLLESIHTFERVDPEDGRLIGVINSLPVEEQPSRPGIFVRVVATNLEGLSRGFEVEISDLTDVSKVGP